MQPGAEFTNSLRSQVVTSARSHTGASSVRLQMRGITKGFGATVALDGVDLTVPAGEVHALVGENGAGKSTLMKVLSGAVRPDGGRMWLDGVPFQPRHPHDARRQGIAMIYQELSLAPHLTVADNIMLGMESTHVGFLRRAATRTRAREALAQLGRDDIAPDTPVRELPLGARQVVEIARAVATGCRVLVLDEPTSSLATKDIDRLFALIRRLKQQGVAVVYISHVLEEVFTIADRYTVLRDGRAVGTGSTAQASPRDLIRLMVGREVTELYPRRPHPVGEVLLEVENLAGIARPVSATLVLQRGVVLGIAGLVGSGRSELLRVLFGLEPVRSGRIRLGAWLGPASPARRWRQGMGFVSEDRKAEGLALNMSIADNITLPSLRGFGPLGLVHARRQQAAVQPWLTGLDIRCRSASQAVAELSGGNQQKVAIARLLQQRVDVLLLDEPTRGIDVGSKAQIYALIDQLACGDPGRGRPPCAVLIVSSYLPELLGICDRIAVMCRGRLGPDQPVNELDAQRIMAQATGAGGAV